MHKRMCMPTMVKGQTGKVEEKSNAKNIIKIKM
jgi:hypothetical protein